MHPKRLGDLQQMADFRLGSVLHALNRAAVEAGGLGEPFLGEVEVYPLDAYSVADSAAGVEDPLFICGGHVGHAAPKIILCQQQNCRII
ncbi:hypothetical protein K388_05621 [Streptomyces sp. KhCrAH-43]|nr:hypothetical protein K388_05621 [Streptomyces sp. KhCrAH-43]